MLPEVHNLFESPEIPACQERTELLTTGGAFRLERIGSNRASSDEGFWYDQPRTEWVALVRGHATLRFEPGGEIALRTGDCLTIAAHHRHRVESTSPDAVWVTLSFEPDC